MWKLHGFCWESDLIYKMVGFPVVYRRVWCGKPDHELPFQGMACQCFQYPEYP